MAALFTNGVMVVYNAAVNYEKIDVLREFDFVQGLKSPNVDKSGFLLSKSLFSTAIRYLGRDK